MGDDGEFLLQPVACRPVAVEAAPDQALLGLQAQQSGRAAGLRSGAEERRFREVRDAEAEVGRRVDGAHVRRGHGVRQQPAGPADVRSGALGDHPCHDRHLPLVLEPALPAVQPAPVDGAQQPGRVEDVGEAVLGGVGVADGVGEHGGGAGAVGQGEGAGGQP